MSNHLPQNVIITYDPSGEKIISRIAHLTQSIISSYTTTNTSYNFVFDSGLDPISFPKPLIPLPEISYANAVIAYRDCLDRIKQPSQHVRKPTKTTQAKLKQELTTKTKESAELIMVAANFCKDI